MFKKILIPVDLSDKHQEALEIAASLAGPHGGEVTLLHVIEVIKGVTMDEERTFYDRIEQSAHNQLQKLGETFGHRQVAWKGEVRYGNRAQSIIRHAVESGTDLILLTSHPIDPDNVGAGWGTLSYMVGIMSQCSVMLVK